MDSQSGIDDLLAAARNGDREAENQLFSQLRARISELVQQRIWNAQRHAAEIRHDAENLTQDICLIILQKYKAASFDHGFMPWIFQIVRYKVGEYYRQRDRKQRIEMVSIADEILQFTADPVQTEQPIEAQEINSMIYHALEKLGRPCKDIIKALLQGEIKDYIAAQQRTTKIDTIYSQISRCRKRFQELLRHEGFEI